MRYVLLGEGALNARCLRWLEERGTPPLFVLADRLTHPEDTPRLTEAQADFGLSIGYRHKLVQAHLDSFARGVVNLHTGYLPHGRGAHPNVHAVLSGEPAGVTLHWMDNALDTGPVIAQQPVPVTFADTAFTLWTRLQDAAFTAFCRWWSEFDREQWWPDGCAQSSDGFPTHTTAELKRIAETPLDLRTLNVLRALTFPGHSGYPYRHTDGHLYDLTINVQRVAE